ncbi:MAG: hypothetical protein A2017_05320 [Lentisphaerae bacterium GWF2_44_16]|nr:MAG: hypothetical protein A2017_05320 [Lentisphaerae bacterium GWF2_44_16]
MRKRELILKEVLNCKDIKKLDKSVFLKAWKAVYFLNPSLHPDDATNPEGGWPKRLKPLALEAFRRFKIGEFSEGDSYCYKEAVKGLEARRTLLNE